MPEQFNWGFRRNVRLKNQQRILLQMELGLKQIFFHFREIKYEIFIVHI